MKAAFTYIFEKVQDRGQDIDVFVIEPVKVKESSPADNSVLKKADPTAQRGNAISKLVNSFYYVYKTTRITDLVAELTNLEGIFAVGVVDSNNEAVGVIIRRQLFDLVGRSYGRNFIENRYVTDIMQYVKSFRPDANILSVSEAITEEMKSPFIKYFLLKNRAKEFCGVFSTKDMLIHLSRVVKKDIALAQTLQARIVKNHQQIKSDTFRIMGCSQMAQDVGGDFYSIKSFAPGKWYLSIADVSGKGFSASLITAIMGALSENFDFSRGLGKFVRLLNKYILKTFFGTGSFITGVFGLFDENESTLTLCDMGHGYLYISRNLKLYQLNKHTNIPLGIDDSETPGIFTLKVKRGDTIYMVTDGIIEQANERGEEYGIGRFKKVIDAGLKKELPEIREAVLEDIDTFRGFHPQHDDITFMVMQF